MTTLRYLPNPAVCFATVELVEAQSVMHAVVAAKRADAEYCEVPIDSPNMLMVALGWLAAAGRLACPAAVRAAASYANACVKVPTSSPLAVTTSERLPVTPEEIVPARDVSEVHIVTSNAVAPPRAAEDARADNK